MVASIMVSVSLIAFAMTHLTPIAPVCGNYEAFYNPADSTIQAKVTFRLPPRSKLVDLISAVSITGFWAASDHPITIRANFDTNVTLPGAYTGTYRLVFVQSGAMLTAHLRSSIPHLTPHIAYTGEFSGHFTDVMLIDLKPSQ